MFPVLWPSDRRRGCSLTNAPRWYSKHYPDRFLSLMVMPGTLASEDEYPHLDRLIGIPVHLYLGEYELWKGKMDTIKIHLDSLGVENQYRVFPGQGHVIESLTSEMLFDTLDTFR